MRKPLIIFLAVIIVSSKVIAQSDSLRSKRPPPLIVAVGAHALSVPWHNKPLIFGFNPGFIIGTELAHKNWKHFRLSQPVNLGYFQHKYIESGLFLNTDLTLSYVTGFGLYADLLLGVGYLHAFSRRDVFELKNGEYERVTDWGRPTAMISLGLALGYEFKSFTPFIQYRWFAQAPFADPDELPAASHLLLTVGTKMYFGGK